MTYLKLKLDGDFVLIRIYDEKNEVIAKVEGKIKENKNLLGEIGNAYSPLLGNLRDLIYFLENPKNIAKALKVSYQYTQDRK